MNGERIIGISPREYDWIEEQGLVLKSELAKSVCKNTGKPFDGNVEDVIIACIDRPLGIIWWYKGSRLPPPAGPSEFTCLVCGEKSYSKYGAARFCSRRCAKNRYKKARDNSLAKGY